MVGEAGEEVAEDGLGRGAGDEEDELELLCGRHRCPCLRFELRRVVRFLLRGMRKYALVGHIILLVYNTCYVAVL